MEATFEPLSRQQLDGLIRAALDLSREELEELVAEWVPLAVAAARHEHRRSGGDITDWESLTDEALWKTARRFDPALGEFSTLFYRIFSRIARKDRAWNRVSREMPAQIEVGEIEAEFTPEMQRAWAALTPRQQHVLERLVICECEVIGLARHFKRTKSRVRQIRDEALAVLRDALEHPELPAQGELWQEAG